MTKEKQSNDFNVTYSNKDIIDKIESFQSETLLKINALIVQTTKTNGRVNGIEEERVVLVNQFNFERDCIKKRVNIIESDVKLISWKIAGIAAIAGTLSSVITILLKSVF